MPNIVLDEVASGYKVSTINENFEKIEQALNSKVLYRETDEPNSMGQSLDANNFPVINVRTPKYNKEAANKLYVDAAIEQALSGVEAGTIDFELLIDRVGDAEAAITTEKLVRASEDEALASSVTQLNASVGQVSADIIQEATARATADSAIASTLDSVSAITNTNSANITAETTARTNQYTALASDITTLQANVGSNTSAITNEQTARVNADNALASSITSLTSQVNTNTAAISSEASTRASADTAIASSVTSLTATVNSNTAAISNEATTRASADSAISSSVSTVSANLGTLSSSVTTQMSAVNTRLGGMESKYTLTVDSGGRISGFESVANPDSSTFTVKADLFKLSMPGYGDYVPFAIGPSDVLFNGVTNWSGVTGTGKPADNASSDLVLVPHGTSVVTLVGNTITKTSGVSAWDVGVYSQDGYVGGAYASVSPLQNSVTIMFGLNSDPSSDASYTSLDYAIYIEDNGNLSRWENGYIVATIGTYVANDVLAVAYDGSTIRFLKNGTVLNSSPVTITNALHFDSSIFNINTGIKNVRFGPLSSNNWNSVGGSGKPQDNATVGAAFGVNITGKITPGNVTTYIDNATINTAQIANAAIKSAQIGDAEIGTAKIADLSITSAKIANASIGSAQIADATITNAKLTGNIQSDNFVTGSSGWQIRRADGVAEFQNVIVRGEVYDTRQYSAGNTVLIGHLAPYIPTLPNNTTLVKCKEIQVARNGTIRVYAEARPGSAWASGTLHQIVIRKNGSNFTNNTNFWSGNNSDTTVKTITVDVSVSPGDLISLWFQSTPINNNYVQNFKIMTAVQYYETITF